ncbi:hypothetical protein [Nitrosomonas ureae]|uniref:Uncharacterized protein n=1 Tax=Nitrosomonas ureae TaxID=44577 RepID=A0A1H2EY20_9PROT|nr:hypothetical protein [Nitrosomonas ureae]ALQ50898.1 hypothetical protein ATY38_06445 [Nitrosomonas ureae]SDU00004.1 hypothetical protein SAMN05216406_11628 [Nitrosomonas ureae]
MIHGKKLTLALAISAAFLLTSMPVFADYSQTQNKIDDKENSPKQAQPHSSSHKKDDSNKAEQNSSENEKRDINSGGPREESPQKSSY